MALRENLFVQCLTATNKASVIGLLIRNFGRWFPSKLILVVSPSAATLEHLHVAVSERAPNVRCASLTGEVIVADRKKQWSSATCVFTTATIADADAERGLFDRGNVCLLIVDEPSRCKGKGKGATGWARLLPVQGSMPRTAPHFRVCVLTVTNIFSSSALQHFCDVFRVDKAIRLREHDVYSLAVRSSQIRNEMFPAHWSPVREACDEPLAVASSRSVAKASKEAKSGVASYVPPPCQLSDYWLISTAEQGRFKSSRCRSLISWNCRAFVLEEQHALKHDINLSALDGDVADLFSDLPHSTVTTSHTHAPETAASENSSLMLSQELLAHSSLLQQWLADPPRKGATATRPQHAMLQLSGGTEGSPSISLPPFAASDTKPNGPQRSFSSPKEVMVPLSVPSSSSSAMPPPSSVLRVCNRASTVLPAQSILKRKLIDTDTSSPAVNAQRPVNSVAHGGGTVPKKRALDSESESSSDSEPHMNRKQYHESAPKKKTRFIDDEAEEELSVTEEEYSSSAVLSSKVESDLRDFVNSQEEISQDADVNMRAIYARALMSPPLKQVLVHPNRRAQFRRDHGLDSESSVTSPTRAHAHHSSSSTASASSSSPRSGSSGSFQSSVSTPVVPRNPYAQYAVHANRPTQ
jgi:hypothetical protein